MQQESRKKAWSLYKSWPLTGWKHFDSRKSQTASWVELHSRLYLIDGSEQVTHHSPCTIKLSAFIPTSLNIIHQSYTLLLWWMKKEQQMQLNFLLICSKSSEQKYSHHQRISGRGLRSIDSQHANLIFANC